MSYLSVEFIETEIKIVFSRDEEEEAMGSWCFTGIKFQSGMMKKS